MPSLSLGPRFFGLSAFCSGLALLFHVSLPACCYLPPWDVAMACGDTWMPRRALVGGLPPPLRRSSVVGPSPPLAPYYPGCFSISQHLCHILFCPLILCSCHQFLVSCATVLYLAKCLPRYGRVCASNGRIAGPGRLYVNLHRVLE